VLVDTSLYISGMQEMMCLMAARFLKIFFIEKLDRRILMGFADRHIKILGIKSLSTQCSDIGEVSYCAGLLGCPPPLTHPPGQAIISMK
jgi:hypothetical protein